MIPDFPHEEMEEQINFHSEDTDFQISNPLFLAEWVNKTILKEGKTLHTINFIFCSDTYLHKINVKYLNHDSLTDVITFPYSEGDQIEGDIFISIERVRENAIELKIPTEEELHRVMIHGVLHLLGFNDKSIEEKSMMRQKENEYLGRLT